MNKRLSSSLAILLGGIEVLISIASIYFAVLNGEEMHVILADAGWILAITFSIVGALIAARRPEHPLGWIYLAIGFSQGLVSFAYNYSWYSLITAPGSLPGGVVMSVLGQVAWIPGLHLLLTYALLLFPTGHLPSPRWQSIAWLSALPLFAFPLLTASIWPHRGRTLLENPGQFQSTGGFLGVVEATFFPYMLLCGLVAIVSLFIRYRNSVLHERQQIKWLFYAAGIVFGAVMAGNFWFSEFLEERQLTYVLTLITAPLLPAAVGIAILRHRWLDIDVIIRRTLVYGALTALLALVYFGGVTLLQNLLSAVSIVISTLAIAALFNPLRRRVQDFIDWRFYRRKYNAEKILTAFSAALRNEVDLEQINHHLLSVIEETMHPLNSFTWLRGAESQTINLIGRKKETLT